MCGLFGWDLNEKKISKGRRAILATALMLGNDQRGGDGWGYWSPDWPAGSNPIKGLGDMARRACAAKLAREARLMAHTRYATVGKVVTRNCHPFVCGQVVGAHNGCLSNFWELDKHYPERYCEVDSQHIFWHLNDELDFLDIEAYGAITFTYRDTPEHLYLGRFNGGDLAIAQTRAGVVWSSDRTHLRTALHCAGLSYRFYNTENDALYYTQDGELYDPKIWLNFAPYVPLLKWNSKSSDAASTDDIPLGG